MLLISKTLKELSIRKFSTVASQQERPGFKSKQDFFVQSSLMLAEETSLLSQYKDMHG